MHRPRLVPLWLAHPSKLPIFLLVAIALRWGLNPNDLKLITAAFVFLALILPNLLAKFSATRVRSPARA